MSATTIRVCAGCGDSFEGRGRAKWCSERCRKAQYAGRCVDCGGPTNGTTPGRGLPDRCGTCSHAHQRETRYWTREAIIGAIQAWADEHGKPPASSDIRTGQPAYPPTSLVQTEFGTWNEAIRAAGFEPFAVGKYGRAGENDDLCREIRERYEAGESPRELASAYGCCEETIRYRVRKVGGTVRSRLRGERVAA